MVTQTETTRELTELDAALKELRLDMQPPLPGFE